MKYGVRFSAEARADLVRLLEWRLERAETVDDLALAERAIDAIEAAALVHLAVTPHSHRKTGRSSTRRELLIPFGASGYVVLYEIDSASTVLVLAVRHQLEADYH